MRPGPPLCSGKPALRGASPTKMHLCHRRRGVGLHRSPFLVGGTVVFGVVGEVYLARTVYGVHEVDVGVTIGVRGLAPGAVVGDLHAVG